MARFGQMWLPSLLLLLPLAAGYAVFDGGTVISNEGDLKAAVGDPIVNTIYVYGTVKLSAAVWPTGAVKVNRTLLITNFPGYRDSLIDGTLAARNALVCETAWCKLSMSGMSFLNAPPVGFDFTTPVPSFLSVQSNGVLNLQEMDVISPSFMGLWNSSNILYNPAFSWWVGNLQLDCRSVTEIVLPSWQSYARLRGQFLNVSGWEKSTSYVNITDVRILLNQDYVCSRFTAAECNSVVEVCKNTNSIRPLPNGSCSPQALSASCRPAPPFFNIATATSDIPLHFIPSPPPNSAASSSHERPYLWWVGLLVGLVVGIGLLGAAFAVLLIRYKRNRSPSSSAAPSPPLPLTGTSSNAAALMMEDAKGHMVDIKCHGPNSTGEDSSISIDPLMLTHPPDMGVATDGSGLRMHHTLKLPDGQESHANGLKTSTPFWQTGPTAAVHHQDFRSITGFSYQSDDSTLRDDRPGSANDAVGSPKAGRKVVIDMGPPTTSGGIPQLGRNPLGATLHALLGTGAYGTVYSGTWGGQHVAVKVIKQQVNDADDLEAILAFKEATLGAELNHPRIVRTLAHALVLPEGLLDEAGRFKMPGTVEAHIVSSLCDRGTLKAWLQTTRTISTAAPVSKSSGLSQPSRLSYVCKVSAFAAQHAPQTSGPLPGPSPPESGSTIAPTHIPTHELGSRPASDTGLLPVSAQPGVPGKLAGPQLKQVQAGQQLPHGHRLSGSGRVGAAAEVLSAAGSIGSGSSALVMANRSSGSEASHAHSSALYPPLVCMPAWGETGVGLHDDFNCHMVAVVDILLEVADGLSYLLSKGVVHGDLKPQNCLCCSDPNSLRGFSIRICDFGISRVLHGSKSHTTVTTPPGTLAYFAPELLSTCRLSPACDLYSFGIIMYELLTGKQPLGSLTMAQVLYKKATGKIDEHLVFPPETPPAYLKLAKACYNLEAASRPSLSDVQARLLEIREQLIVAWQLPLPPPPAPASTSSPPGSASMPTAAAVLQSPQDN